MNTATNWGLTSDMLEARMVVLSRFLTRRDIFDSLVSDADVLGSPTIIEQVKNMTAYVLCATLESKIKFMEDNPDSFLNNPTNLLEELYELSQYISSDECNAFKIRISDAGEASKEAKKEWLGDFYKW